MDAKTTALVLIEFQNDFTSEGGTLHGAVAEVMAATDTVGHASQAMAAAHSAGATVIHSPISFAPGYIELSAHPYGILKGVVDSTSFVKGTWGCEIVETMAPADGDIVLEGKRGLDAFGSTNLDFILRSIGIKTVVLAGFLTNCCVESTMRSAYEKGFEVYTLTDAVGATSIAEHENAITFDYPMFSKPITTQDFVAQIAGVGAGVGDTSRGY